MTERSPSPLPPTIQHQPIPVYAGPTASPDVVKIFNKALLLTEGRDKVVKLLQYTSRLILLFSSSPTRRLRPLISQMSMTRKVLKLGHGIYPYSELVRERLETFALIRAIVEFVNDFWDDVYCLSRIGFLRGARLQKVSEDWANRAWMTGIVMDLYVLMQRRRVMALKLNSGEEKKHLDVSISLVAPGEPVNVRNKLKLEAYWLDVSIAKLLADFGFCGISIPHCNTYFSH